MSGGFETEKKKSKQDGVTLLFGFIFLPDVSLVRGQGGGGGVTRVPRLSQGPTHIEMNNTHSQGH